MKNLRIAVAVVALGALASPAPAQQQFTSASHTFLKAVKERDGNKVTDMLQSQPTLIGARDGDGNTALLIAIARKDQVWTSYFIGQDADVNVAGKDGDRPLIVAARFGFKDAAELLIRRGANVDASNRRGETALIAAVQGRHAPLVKLLLDAGANPDETDSSAGLSARDYARRDTRSRQILQLIEAKKPSPSAAASNR